MPSASRSPARSTPPRGGGGQGYSLVEVLLSLLISLVVLALVFKTAELLINIYRSESKVAQQGAAVAIALDDMVVEIGRAGHGFGDGIQSVFPHSGGERGITIRSSDNGIVTRLQEELSVSEIPVRVDSPESFREADKVLLTDGVGMSERAEVVEITPKTLSFRSLVGSADDLARVYVPGRGARVLKLREVGYWLEPSPDGKGSLLMKSELGRPPRALARNITALRFEFLDDRGRRLSDESLERPALLSTVRIILTFSTGSDASDEKTLATAVTLDPQAGSMDFALPGYGLRLTRYFHPIKKPMGVATRTWRDWGVILAAGLDPARDRPYLYSFMAEKRFLDPRSDSVTWLEDVRGPVAMCFGPENTPMAGSLFLAAFGLRIGHLTRVHPDSHGVISWASEVETFEGTEALAQIGGMSFGVDHALYVASQERGAIFRYRFDETGKPMRLKEVTKVKGSPGSLVQAADGNLYFLSQESRSSGIWQLPFDGEGSPQAPVQIHSTEGRGISLAADPMSGSLFVLVRERLGDYVVLELSSGWLSSPQAEPKRIFSLEDFREETMEGRKQDRETERLRALSPIMIYLQLPTLLIPDDLDFVAFDQLGLMYLGAHDRDLVLKFDLDRTESSRHRIAVAGVVQRTRRSATGSPKVRLHAWREAKVGL